MKDLQKEKIIDIVTKFYDKQMKDYNKIWPIMTTGKLRDRSGKIMEDTVELLYNEIRKNYTYISSKIKTGNQDFILCVNPGGKMKAQVDKHCYVDEKLILLIEVKTYLEASYLKRAKTDVYDIKMAVENPIQAIIVAAEYASIHKETLGYLMWDQKIDKIFYLIDWNIHGRRSPSKPLYKIPKPLSREKLKILINYIINYFEEGK